MVEGAHSPLGKSFESDGVVQRHYFVNIFVFSKPYKVMLDPGSTASLMGQDVAHSLGLVVSPLSGVIELADGSSSAMVCDTAHLSFHLARTDISHKFLICFSLTNPGIILGQDFFEDWVSAWSFDFPRRVTLKNSRRSVPVSVSWCKLDSAAALCQSNSSFFSALHLPVGCGNFFVSPLPVLGSTYSARVDKLLENVLALRQQEVPSPPADSTVFNIFPQLSDGARASVSAVLQEFSDLFQEVTSFGNVRGFCHTIDTGAARPIRCVRRRRSRLEHEFIRQEVAKMLSLGVVRPSKSQWVSELLLVAKDGGSKVRMAVDYRPLNSVTIPEPVIPPRIDELLDVVGNAKFFVKLDISSAYWQMPVHPESICKTAFRTVDGFFEFLVMPFGVRNAPAQFCAMMDKILEGLNWHICCAYIDDLLIWGDSCLIAFDRFFYALGCTVLN